MPPPKKKVAAIVTEYRRHSHAGVIAGKIVEGYRHDGGAGPNLQLVSLYVDKAPSRDMSLPQQLVRDHGVGLYDTIADALTLGTGTLAVDGVLCIAVDGPYPSNPQGQVLYPQRRFFAEIYKVFTAAGRGVPIFTSKQLATTWADAKWIYDQARALSVPLLAGSVLPVAWRQPPSAVPLNAPLVEAVQLGYRDLEAYGFHALECLQCQAERRQGGETGVAAVQCLTGPTMWEQYDQGGWSLPLLEAALSREPYHRREDYRERTLDPASNAALFLIEYRDGFKAAVPLLNGWVYEGDGGAFIFAGKIQGQPLFTILQYLLQLTPPFGHFAALVRAIDFMMEHNQTPYPVERTLLTTGVLDAIFTSKAQGGQRVATPELAVSYQAVDWSYSTDPVPAPVQW